MGCHVAGLAGAAALLCVGGAAAGEVTVRIHDVASCRGEVLVALCDRAQFLKDCALKGRAKANRGAVVVKFSRVRPGRYAAVAFHDENGDRQLNRSRSGVPTEGRGFSRDAAGVNGPPVFDQAAVAIGTSPAVLDITLSYF